MYLIKALRVERIKSKRTMLNIIPFVLSIIVVSSIFFLCRTSSKDEIVSESIHYWISISAMIAPLLVGILAGIMGEQELSLSLWYYYTLVYGVSITQTTVQLSFF